MSFEEQTHNLYTNIDLIFKWIIFRTNEIEFVPFIYLSFRLNNDRNLLHDKVKRVNFDLSSLVDKKIKESFDIIFN